MFISRKSVNEFVKLKVVFLEDSNFKTKFLEKLLRLVFEVH